MPFLQRLGQLLVQTEDPPGGAAAAAVAGGGGASSPKAARATCPESSAHISSSMSSLFDLPRGTATRSAAGGTGTAAAAAAPVGVSPSRELPSPSAAPPSFFAAAAIAARVAADGLLYIEPFSTGRAFAALMRVADSSDGVIYISAG